jgi:hypothetical protein
LIPIALSHRLAAYGLPLYSGGRTKRIALRS